MAKTDTCKQFFKGQAQIVDSPSNAKTYVKIVKQVHAQMAKGLAKLAAAHESLTSVEMASPIRARIAELQNGHADLNARAEQFKTGNSDALDPEAMKTWLLDAATWAKDSKKILAASKAFA